MASRANPAGRWAGLCLALALTVSFLPTETRAGGTRRLRLVVANWKQLLSDTESYSSYAAKVEARFRKLSPLFARSWPTLVFLPEDTGLAAWLVGPKGEASRRAPNSTAAIAALAGPYSAQVAFYASSCPGVSPERTIVLALTDTAWRALMEPVAKEARRYGVWVLVSLNAPEVRVTRDPARVTLLTAGDPALAGARYAYEAAGCDVYNTALLVPPWAALDPDGAADPARVVAGRQRKMYLVPIERNQVTGTGSPGLAFSSELVSEARPLSLAFPGQPPLDRLGVLTSKDAWMPDVAERLAARGANLFLQPEAGEWAAGVPPDWPPDDMMRAVWAMVQRHQEFLFGALSDLTGNFFDLPFDGTPAITKDALPTDPPNYLLGMPPGPGFIARGDWVMSDPPPGVALRDVAVRRERLGETVKKLRPGSGDPLENGYLESEVYADLELPEPPPSPSRRWPVLKAEVITPDPSGGPQWKPHLSPAPWGFVLAWTDLRAGNEQPYLALVGPSRGEIRVARAGDAGKRPFDQQGNQYGARAAALPDGTVAVVWADFRNQSWDVYATTGKDLAFSPSRRIDPFPTSGEGFPNENISSDLAIAGSGGRLFLSWSVVRERSPDRDLVLMTSEDGRAWVGERYPAGQHDGHDQFAPTLTASPDGTLFLAWQDMREGRSIVWWTRSSDGGSSFSLPQPVSRPAPGIQQWDPAIALCPEGPVLAWAEGNALSSRIRLAVWEGGSFRAGPETPAGALPRQSHPTLACSPSGRLFLAWQEEVEGGSRIVLSWGTPGGGLEGPLQVPSRGSSRLPSLAASGTLLGLAWEEEAAGKEGVRVAVLREENLAGLASPESLPATGREGSPGAAFLFLLGALALGGLGRASSLRR